MKKNKSYRELYEELFLFPKIEKKPHCNNCFTNEEKLNDVKGKYWEWFNLLCENCEKDIRENFQKQKSEKFEKTKLEQIKEWELQGKKYKIG